MITVAPRLCTVISRLSMSCSMKFLKVTVKANGPREGNNDDIDPGGNSGLHAWLLSDYRSVGKTLTN